MGKVIILAGAPDAASLDWSALPAAASSWQHDSTDWSQWQPVFPERGSQEARKEDATFTSDSHSQRHDWSVSSADVTLSFRLPNALPSDSFTASQELIEHSLALHNALPSSLPEVFDAAGEAEVAEAEAVAVAKGSQGQPQRQLQYPSTDSDVTASMSFATTTTSFTSTPPPLPSRLPPWQPLTHLADLPTARVLAHRGPRTVTVNLAVAVVAVTAPRAVNVRTNAHATASLVELVVGDDTRSGFGITVWLDAQSQPQRQPSSVAALLATLQPQDILLVRNLALNVFNGKVYGSTLRHNQTQMHVLWRQRSGDDSLFAAAHLAAAAAGAVTADETEAGWRLAAKTARVREWALQYVVGARGGDGTAGNIWMQPPADTQSQ